MLFFLNDNIQLNMSGIEHAQIKRLHLFNQYKKSAKIVTRRYSNELHEVTKEVGIPDENFVNMFDYFQDAVMVKPRRVEIQDLSIDPSLKRQADGVSYNYYRGKQRVMYVRRANDKHVMNVQYFDRFGKLIKVSWYDHRGFLSVDQLYDWDSKITVQNYYRPDGSKAIQLMTSLDKADHKHEVYHLFNYKGSDYQFMTFDELYRFFLDELVVDERYTNGEKVGLEVDRTYELAWSVLHMKHRVFRLLQLHNAHLNNGNDILHSDFNYNYAWALNHLQDWDGVVTLTPHQQKDVAARWGKTGIKIYQIPSAVVSDEVLARPHVPFESRHKYEVVEVARLSPEKQQDHLIKVWPKVLKKLPEAQLNLWGYVNDNFDKKLKKMVKDEGMEKYIHFKGYSENVGKIYDTAQLMVLPSRAEGLALVLVEGQSHGLPAVANDIKYGPSDVIVDGHSGLLTQNGDLDGLANAIIDLLTNQDKLKEFSENAYEDAQRFSTENMMKLWDKVIDDLNKWEDR